MLKNYKEILNKSRNRVLDFASIIFEACELAADAFKDSDIHKANTAREKLKNAHDINSKIDNEIIKTLALFSPEAKDLRVVIAHLKIASELTRISDYVRSCAKSIKMQISGEFDLSTLRDDTIAYMSSTKKSLYSAIESLKTDSPDKLEELYRTVNVEESKCDDIHSILEQNAMEQICLTPEIAKDFIVFLKSMRKLERISDRSLNIVKLSFFAQKGGKLKL
ncbi:MAG: phosphate uptake regulator PhoU [Epsilonproteobacteria bacterium]|nr:phosphate uptake regulator PhoU [Campylobacterota bacterium]